MASSSKSGEKIQRVQAKIKEKISANHEHYVHCGLRDPVSFSDNPLTSLDWYTSLIAAQASVASYGQPAEAMKKSKHGEIQSVADSGKLIPESSAVRKINFHNIPPLDSVQKEYLSRMEDLFAYLQSSEEINNFFIDHKDSDLQAWYCVVKKPLYSVLDSKVISSDKPSARVQAAIMGHESDPQANEDIPQVILAFRGTKGLQDVGSDVAALKVPLTWPGETPSPLQSIFSLSRGLSLLASAASAAGLALLGRPRLGAAFIGAAAVALYLNAVSVRDLEGGEMRAGPKMADEYGKLTAEKIQKLVEDGSKAAAERGQGRNRLAGACAELLREQSDFCQPLLAHAAVHQGFLQMYHSVRDDIIQLLEHKDLREPGGKFRAAVLVCGHSMGGALARLCAFDLVAQGRVPAELVSLVSFGSGPIGNRALAKLTDLLHLRSDLHFVNARDPVPAAVLSLSEGGLIPSAVSNLLLRGSYSFSGSKIWFAHGEGDAYEPLQDRRPLAGAAATLYRFAGTLSPTGGSVSDHSLVNYVRKVAACAVAAGIAVESTFAGSLTLAPPPVWAQRILRAQEARAPV